MSNALPLLPGFSFNDPSKKRFHKTHHFERLKGVAMLSDTRNTNLSYNKPISNDLSLYPPESGPSLPAWLAYDRKVLCFHGYFKETLQELNHIPYQVRKVKIFYYLEDGTIQVSEPKTSNSGIPQGCLVSRQRIPLPPPHELEYITLLELNVNQSIQLFDRCYQVTGCDLYTRDFLNRCGIVVADCQQPPVDPSDELRQQQYIAMQPKKPGVKVDTLAKFLENDRKVLRFHGFWDDRASECGDLHKLEILYFLADDTIEVHEIFGPNSGRESNGIFLKREKLIKDFTGQPKMGEKAAYTILNVLGKGLSGGRHLPDRLNVGAKKQEHYKDCDLSIGITINIFGRSVKLTGCDKFTEDYYRKKYGIEDFTPEPIPEQPLSYYVREKNRELPPFNGWGSHADSEGNCITVEPKPPKIDFQKFLKLDGYILRFGAQMISKFTGNADRVFLISYYLADDTLAVYEFSAKNCGFVGGDFFKRSTVFQPNQEWFTSTRPKIYKPEHFYLGAKVNLRNYIFYVESADIFTLKFMESCCEDFPLAHSSNIMSKIREALRPIYKSFIAKYMEKTISKEVNGECLYFICYEHLREMLIELLGDNITEHEIVTICRRFSAENENTGNKCDKEVVRSITHYEMRKALWTELDRFKEHLYHLEPTNPEFISQKKLISAFRACKLPFDIALVEKMFLVLNKNSNDDIEQKDVIDFLDPKAVPSCPMQPINIKRNVCLFKPFIAVGRLIDWNCFLKEIDLEEKLKNESK